MLTQNKVVNETRKNLRIRENQSVRWSVNESQQSGQGKILNISSTGMLLEAETTVEPLDQAILRFDSILGENNYVPETGELIWHKRKNGGLLCGVRFVDSSQNILTRLNQHIQSGIAKENRMRRVNNILNILLIGAVIVLLFIVVKTSLVVYDNIHRSNEQMFTVSDQQAGLNRKINRELTAVKVELVTTKQLYAESQLMLQSVSQDLESTKIFLAQTETMLSLANDEISELKGEVLSTVDMSQKQMEETKMTFQKMLSQLKQKNVELTKELSFVKERLRLFEGNVIDEKEANSVILLLKQKLGVVKSKIRGFRLDALNLRVAAQKERDRIKSTLGNKGYLLKDGDAVIVDKARYNSVDQIPDNQLGIGRSAVSSEHKVDINVKIVE